MTLKFDIFKTHILKNMIKCNMRSIIASKAIMLNLIGIIFIVALTGLNASSI